MGKVKRMLAVMLAAVMMMGVSACGAEEMPEENANMSEAEEAQEKDTASQEETEAESPQEYDPVSLRFAYMPNMGGASLFVTARDFGFFEKYNIDATLVEFGDGPSEISAMASGDIDIAMIGHGAHALCCEGSAVVFYSDAIGLSSAVIANTDSGIESVADLKGKRVAYVAGTGSEELLKLALSKAGMTIEDVEAVNFDVAGMVTAMASGQVDAAASSAPYTGTIEAQLGDKFIMLCEDRDFLEERTLMNSEICTREFMDENKEVLVRVSCALLEAADYRSANIEEVAVAVSKQCEGSEEAFLELVDECMWISGKDVQNYINSGELDTFYANAQEAFINSGRLEEAVPVKDYVSYEMMEEACKLVYGE